MSNLNQLQKFFELHSQGLNCALDVRTDTGEVLCSFTRNLDSGREGAGTPGIPYSGLWARVADCRGGDITGAER